MGVHLGLNWLTNAEGAMQITFNMFKGSMG